MENLAKWTQLLWQEQRFKLWILQSPANQFEDIFTRVMRASFKDTFHAARPVGTSGDLKCDGWDAETKTLYAVYAPFSPKRKSAIRAKVRSDFYGAIEKWPEMRRWRLVHNDFFGLSAELTRELESLRNESTERGVEILSDWDPQELWQIVRRLPEIERFELLGGPDFSSATDTSTWQATPLRHHEDVHPAVVRAAVAAVSSICDNFQPDGLLDPLCSSAFARALTAWWLDDESLFQQYLEFLLDRCDATPFEAQLTSMVFVMRCAEICAQRLSMSSESFLQAQLGAGLHQPGAQVLIKIALEQIQGNESGFHCDDSKIRKKFVQGCGQVVIEFLGITAAGTGIPAILTLQDLLTSLQRLDYNDGILIR
ncbi:hypothetical protein ABZ616_08285 [Streptomyces noursei]|uniref:hypothetical protein n=1 Tax=Streptomyces noursei TaxID=1971 RepID=UPI003402719F